MSRALKAEGEELRIMSGEDMAAMDIPDITYYTDGILRVKGKATLFAKEKMGKSFLAIQWGMCVASGNDWLGHRTTQGNVLYVNFEIAEEKLIDRVRDLERVLGYNISRFHAVTIPEGLSLDTNTDQLEELLETHKAQYGFVPDVLILDPRRNAMRGDENQTEVMNAFCQNLNRVMDWHNLAIVVVHHEGKSTTGAGRGSSVWDGWLDTIIRLEETKTWVAGTGSERILTIRGRDMEAESLGVSFKYPVYEVDPNVVVERDLKTAEAERFIRNKLSAGPELQKELRGMALEAGHSAYAFNNALKTMRESGEIETEKAAGKGNKKVLTLKPETDSPRI